MQFVREKCLPLNENMANTHINRNVCVRSKLAILLPLLGFQLEVDWQSALY